MKSLRNEKNNGGGIQPKIFEENKNRNDQNDKNNNDSAMNSYDSEDNDGVEDI